MIFLSIIINPSIFLVSSLEDSSVTIIPLSLINFFLFILSIAIFVWEKFLYGGSEKIKSIKSIDVYRNNYLQLEIDIKDREPIAYIRELNSYMDSSGVIFKKYNLSIDSIPEIKGILTDGEEFKILKVISALENDDFFENKLKSISLKGNDIYLNIKGFDFDIRFGNEFQLKNKLNMLKGFYIYQFDNLSNKKYKQVDLVYNNRLIAIKN